MQGLCASNAECIIPFGDLVQFKLHQHCRVTTAMTAVSSEEETRPAVPINHALVALTCISEDSWSLPTGTAVQTQALRLSMSATTTTTTTTEWTRLLACAQPAMAGHVTTRQPPCHKMSDTTNSNCQDSQPGEANRCCGEGSSPSDCSCAYVLS